jgi:hypothetical protein
MNCEFCSKTFSTKSNLISHQRTTKYCLDIQGKENKTFVCTFCSKTFSLNQTLQEHYQTCKQKKHNDIVKIIQEKDKIIQEKDEYIAKLEARLEKFEDAIIESSKKPNTTNNNTDNSTTNIIVTNNNTLNLTDKEAIKEIVNEKLTQNYVCNGQRGLAKFAYDNILTDENGNLKYKCVDPSRQNFEFTNNNGIIERDVKANKLKQALIDSNVIRQAGSVGEKVWTNADGTVDNDRFDVFNTKVLEILSVDKDDAKFRTELSILTSQ